MAEGLNPPPYSYTIRHSAKLCADAFSLVRLAVRDGVFEKCVQELQLFGGVVSLLLNVFSFNQCRCGL